MHWDTFKQGNHSTVGGDGGCRVGSYLADPSSPIPSRCAVIILCKSVPVHQLACCEKHLRVKNKTPTVCNYISLCSWVAKSDWRNYFISHHWCYPVQRVEFHTFHLCFCCFQSCHVNCLFYSSFKKCLWYLSPGVIYPAQWGILIIITLGH